MVAPGKMKRNYAEWMVLAIALALLYVLSFGPALGIFVRLGHPDWLARVIDTVYLPAEVVHENLPRPWSTAYGRYTDWWTELAGG